MIFDSTMLAAAATELQPLLGSRLRDLWLAEPFGNAEAGEARALYLSFAAGSLVIDTHPQRARLHLTESAPHPSVHPAPFIEAARKNLRGARLTELSQPEFDRVLRLGFAARDAIGDLRHFTLVAELMERRSNIILLDENDVIIDALKRLPPFLNRARTVLPHRPYSPPPGGKASPLAITDWDAWLSGHCEEEIQDGASLIALLRGHFNGISPLLSRIINERLTEGLPPAEVCTELFRRVAQAARGDIDAALCGDQPYPFALSRDCAPAAGPFGALIETQLDRSAERQGIESGRAQLLAHLARREKKLAAQREDVDKSLRHAAEAEKFRAQGQLLLANLPKVEQAAAAGRDFVELSHDWSAAGEVERIPIEPKWPAADNATRCFNRYKRARKLAADAPRRANELAAECAALASLRRRVEAAATEAELGALSEEAGFSRAPERTLSRTREQQQAARPENKLRRSEIGGWAVYMGRSALENQLLLSKVARPSDIWMHVRGMPSAHVLIKAQKGRKPPPAVLHEAGRWVATAGRSGKKYEGELMEIIYTEAKWVRAVKGSPGKVTLQRFETFDVKL